jgi:hypothetical protein
MPYCPHCNESIPVWRVLTGTAPGMNFSRNTMRFRLRCSACGSVVGLEPGAVRTFFFAWLLPVVPLAWLSGSSFPRLFMVAAVAWLVLFPALWLRSSPLVLFERAGS